MTDQMTATSWMERLKNWNRQRLDLRKDERARRRHAGRDLVGAQDADAPDRFVAYQAAWTAQHIPGPHHEKATVAGSLPASDVQVVCFYLPQFHAVAENDGWWGAGFTEWRNVTRAQPRFEGHNQPQLPADLGFYDLSHPGTLPRQIKLARQAGITGFNFYYYSFDGKRILEKPLEDFLSRQDLDFDFCITWANENWTRRWDGLNHDVLLKQTYGVETESDLFDDFCRHFEDPRYIRVDGRPLFTVYRPRLIPDAKAWVSRLRQHCLSRLHSNPYLMMMQGFGQGDPRDYGMDASVEFPPHELTQRINPAEDLSPFDPGFAGTYYRYQDLVDASLNAPVRPHDHVRCVAPGWDNEARRPGRGTGFVGATPERYEFWLRESIAYARRYPIAGDTRLVCVNAWNEWAEGAHLEPDLKHGHAYLNATRRAIEG